MELGKYLSDDESSQNPIFRRKYMEMSYWSYYKNAFVFHDLGESNYLMKNTFLMHTAANTIKPSGIFSLRYKTFEC